MQPELLTRIRPTMRGGVPTLDEAARYIVDAYGERYGILKVFTACPSIHIVPSWSTPDDKERIIFELLTNGAEGVVFKDTLAPYQSGRAGQHFKLKFEKSATVRIRNVDPVRDRASIEMLDGREWREVSGIKVQRSRVRPGDYIEVRYFSASASKRLVQPVFIRRRTDVSDQDCSMDQLEFGGRWALLKRPS